MVCAAARPSLRSTCLSDNGPNDRQQHKHGESNDPVVKRKKYPVTVSPPNNPVCDALNGYGTPGGSFFTLSEMIVVSCITP